MSTTDATDDAATNSPGSQEQTEQPHTKDRGCCDWYLSARGCIKGDSCDFAHPLAPSGALTNKVCEFISTQRGCVKGDKCDFLHPLRLNPRGQPTTRVCDFFLQPQGCLKGNQCDFLHPRVIPAQHLAPVPAARGGMRGAGRAGPAGGFTVRVCEFFMTPAGCNRGHGCQFLHPTGRAAQQALAAKEAGVRGAGRPVPMCDYHFSRRGCSKGDSCPFSHSREPPVGYGGFAPPAAMYGPPMVQKRPKVCNFFASERGCVKGDMCEFIHVKDKACEFFMSERGCKKGSLCDFAHRDFTHTREGE